MSWADIGMLNNVRHNNANTAAAVFDTSYSSPATRRQKMAVLIRNPLDAVYRMHSV
jgi:hypothetical protein